MPFNSIAVCYLIIRFFVEKSTEYRYKQMERLENMAGDPMSSELKYWVRQRLHILRSIENKDEL